MENKSLYKHIRLTYDENASKFKGNIELKAGSTIRLNKITIRVIFEIRGTLRPSMSKLETIELESDFLLEGGRMYKIPFEFDCSSFEYESYNGSYVTFSYKLNTVLFIHEEDTDKVERSTWDKLKSITDLHTKIEWSRDFVYKNKNIAYQITPGEHILETKFLSYILYAFITLVFLGLLSFNLSTPVIFIIIGVAIYIIYSAYNVIKTYPINLFKVKLDINENGFLCELTDRSPITFKTKDMYYKVEECVLDDRGTRDIIYSETIFQSTPRQMDPKPKVQQINFGYPKRKDIRKVHHSYVEFKWYIAIEVTYWNIPIYFSQEFEIINIEAEV